MAKHIVNVMRMGFGNREIEVDADSREEAEQKTLDEAGNHLYSEKDAEYYVESPSIVELGDITTYLEIARLAFAAIPDDIVDNLDMSDDEFLRLRDQLQQYMDKD